MNNSEVDVNQIDRKLIYDFVYSLPLFCTDRLNGKTTAFLQQNHVFQAHHLAQFIQWNDARKRLHVTKIYHIPGRIFRITLWIIVVVVDVKCTMIGISFFYNFGDTSDTGRVGVAVIKENKIAILDAVTQIVACLVVPNTIPVRGFLRCLLADLRSKTQKAPIS